MNSPIKMLGNAPGIATRKIKYARLAPSVRATSRYEARVFEIPEAVSIVTGNQTASAINAADETIADGERTIANGIQAVAGIGPTTFRSGIPQYLIGDDQPMQIPLIKPPITPSVYPLKSKARECQVLSSKRTRSLIKLL